MYFLRGKSDNFLPTYFKHLLTVNQYIISHTCEEVGLETTTKFLKLFGQFSSCQSHKFFTRFNKSHLVFYRPYKIWPRTSLHWVFCVLSNGTTTDFFREENFKWGNCHLPKKKKDNFCRYQYIPHNFVVFSTRQ